MCVFDRLAFPLYPLVNSHEVHKYGRCGKAIPCALVELHGNEPPSDERSL